MWYALPLAQSGRRKHLRRRPTGPSSLACAIASTEPPRLIRGSRGSESKPVESRRPRRGFSRILQKIRRRGARNRRGFTRNRRRGARNPRRAPRNRRRGPRNWRRPSAESEETEHGIGGDRARNQRRPSAILGDPTRRIWGGHAWKPARMRAQCTSQYAHAGGLFAFTDCGARRILQRLPSLHAFERASMPYPLAWL